MGDTMRFPLYYLASVLFAGKLIPAEFWREQTMLTQFTFVAFASLVIALHLWGAEGLIRHWLQSRSP